MDVNSILVFAHLSALSAVLPILAGVYRWRYLTYACLLLFILVVIAGLSDLVALYLSKNGYPTWSLFNLFYLIQFILIFMIFKSQAPNKLLNIGVYFLLLFAFINFTWIQGARIFNSYTSYGGGLILVAYSLLYLYRLLRDTPVENIYNLPIMWVSFGVLFYFSGTIFIFLFNNLLISYKPLDHKIGWVLHNVFNLLKNILFAIGLWKCYKISPS